MAKIMIARGQTTVYTQNDAYTINQSVNEYVFTAANNGTITGAITFSSTIKVNLGDKSITDFTIGVITKPNGFTSIVVDNSKKTVTYSVAANTTNLADSGIIMIPVIIQAETYYLSFTWSKAKGGATGNNGQDAYTVSLSRNNYVIATDKAGRVHAAVTITTVVSALKGSSVITPVIGTLPAVPGCTLTKSGTTVTIVFTAGTALSENGIIDIPVTADSKAFSLSFTYAKAKTGADGATGAAGVDANMLDWVKDWDTNKTVIGTTSVITPKIFAGVKNSNGTLTGIAIGKFALSTLNASGAITTETINGIYGFKDGYKTFFVDSNGNAQLGKSNQFIKYNAATGKIEFGSDVSLNWTTAANNALASAKTYADTKKTEAINTAATDATNKANQAKTDAITTAAADATAKANTVKNIALQANDLAIRKVRYIRDWLNGSTANTGNHWVQIMAYDKAGENIALNKNVSGGSTDKRITNGNTATSPYTSVAAGLKHLIVDLGAVYEIAYIQVWHYYSDGRTYYGTKTECSIDGTTWFVIFDSSTEGIYKETSNGIIHYVSEYDRTTRKTLLAQETADAITKKAGDEKWATKLTYIDSTGIFTGTLSANTVNALKINASQITAGTIDITRLNVDVLKASLITAANINALTLTVNKGTIGGWTIDGDSIFRGTKNNTSGAYTAASGAITIGSNGIRGFKWRLDSNGTGALAGGNISWDASGNVTFGSSVSLNWTNAANNALASAKTYADTKKTEAISTAAADASTKANQAKTDAISTAASDATTKVNNIQVGGRNLIPSTNKGITGWAYTCQSGTHVHSAVTSLNVNANKSTTSVISSGYHVITRSITRSLIKNNTQYTISFDIYCDFDTTLGLSIRNSNGTNILVTWNNTAIKKNTWIRVVQTATSGTDTTTAQILYITGFNTVGSVTFANIKLEEGNKATQWTPAPEDVDSSVNAVKSIADKNLAALGGASYPKLTQISSTGIYTGTLIASQITAGTISADRIAVGSLNASKLDAASIKSGIINTDYINGLTCTFVRGKIGGWTIGTDNIMIGSLNVVGQTPIQIRSTSTGSGTVYNGGFKPYGITLSWYQSSNAGHIGLGQVLATGSTVRTGFMGIQMIAWDGVEYFCLSANTTKSGGKEVYNRIANWAFDNDSIYRGTKNNTAAAFTTASGSITIGSNGIRGFKWRLDSTGAGAIAGGNISWDASGNVTFAASVSLNWTNAVNTAKTELNTSINSIVTALGGITYPKLTKIDSTGIYTGTLTATQIIAGTISSDRIAAGSINSTKLDAASVKANIINVAYINGLTCAFVRGTIGGWTIGSDTITIGVIGGTGAIPIQIRSSSTGSGYVYSGQYKPLGITMTWHQSSNAGHIVFGQVMSAGNAVKTGFIGIQMLAWDNTEYFCLSANYTKTGGKEVYNRIAGWAFDNDSIFRGTKNNAAAVYTAAAGSITIGSNGIRGFKWRLDSTGAGAVAGGNISWDASGNVTFGSSVSLNWTNAANNALASAKTYADTKKTEAISTAATDATTKSEAAKELALAMAFGKMLYRDPIFYNGNNGLNAYNNSGNGTVTITRTSDSNAPNDSKQVLVIKNTGTSSPNCGGFYWATTTSYRKIFITRIIAKIPSGRNISYHSNNIGTGGSQKWLTPVSGTGDWYEYICKVSCGTASFSSTHYFAITGTVGTADAPVEWRVAYATVFDNTSTEKYTTTIDANGIYTGTIRANQVLIDSALVVGGSSYNGSISVRDASNAVKVTLDRNGITAVGGTIGGWVITSTQISKNSVILGSDGTISNGTKWKLGNDGSGFVANGNVSWTAAGAVSITGTINATSGVIGGFSISGNRLINTATNSSIEFLTLTGSSSLSINASTSTLLSMRADSARTALSIQTYATGAKGISIIANAGSTFAIDSYGPHQFGQRSGEKWNAPGVLFSAIVKNSSTLYNKWGNGLTVTSFSKIETGGFMCYHNLGHTEYTVMATPYWDSVTNYHGNSFIRVEFITSTSFKLRVVNADNGKQVDTNFTFCVIGRNKW